MIASLPKQSKKPKVDGEYKGSMAVESETRRAVYWIMIDLLNSMPCSVEWEKQHLSPTAKYLRRANRVLHFCICCHPDEKNDIFKNDQPKKNILKNGFFDGFFWKYHFFHLGGNISKYIINILLCIFMMGWAITYFYSNIYAKCRRCH